MDQSLTSEKLNFLHQLLDKELEGLKDSSLSNSGMHSNATGSHSEAPLKSRLHSTGNNHNNQPTYTPQIENHHGGITASSILESSLNVSSLH